MKNRICFFISNDYKGEINLDSEVQIPYEELIKNISKARISSLVGLRDIGYSKYDVKFVTPEQYDGDSNLITLLWQI